MGTVKLPYCPAIRSFSCMRHGHNCMRTLSALFRAGRQTGNTGKTLLAGCNSRCELREQDPPLV
eukprot:6205083-Pleurochrysis_carterae.AAC.7